jgi:hypothetical protein
MKVPLFRDSMMRDAQTRSSLAAASTRRFSAVTCSGPQSPFSKDKRWALDNGAAFACTVSATKAVATKNRQKCFMFEKSITVEESRQL